MLCRLGGDEFAVLLDGVESERDIIRTVKRIQQACQEPFRVEGHNVKVGTSIGIAPYTPPYERLEDLIGDADIAMYHAKNLQRGSYCLFSAHMRKEVQGRLGKVNRLREAIENGRLVLHFQPIVTLESGRVEAFEALVRWPDPDKNGELLAPGAFIPLAEETGLIIPLTRWVLRNACETLRQWQDNGAGSVAVSINLCADYFAEEDMPQEIISELNRNRLPPDSIRLEITETQIIKNANACLRNIRHLRRAGIKVYIDDFGTGYSSLNYLSSFKVNALKIDRSFISKIAENTTESSVVRAICSLGESLGMEVIAEGIENEDQLACLRSLKCTHAQGFLLSKPVPAENAEKLIGKTFGAHE